MNNYDRIYKEVSKESKALGLSSDLEPDMLIDLIMEILSLEDQHQDKRIFNITQQVQDKILSYSRTQNTLEENYDDKV